MEKAGIPIDKSFSLLKLPQVLHYRIDQTQRLLHLGNPIAKAGERTQLFSKLEVALLESASNAGRLYFTYSRLSHYYRERASQSASMKAKLLLPIILLVVCVLIRLIPDLVNSDILLSSALVHAVKPLAVVASIISLFLLARSYFLGSCPIWIDRLFQKSPIYGPMYIRTNARDFFETLALLLDAGIPILEALPKAVSVIQSATMKKTFSRIELSIKRGDTLSQALHSNAYMKRNAAIALIETGEASGTLSEMLFRWAAMETEILRAFYKNVADWTPRFIYVAIVIWMVLSFI